MNTYFAIRYEFEKMDVHKAIVERLKNNSSDYICVADGVVLNNANRKADYLAAVNGGMFSICDSSYVPLYLRWIYGKKYEQYCGCQIFEDIVRCEKYRMLFLGGSQEVLEGLKSNIQQWNPAVAGMSFVALPFQTIDEFDYAGIARMIEQDGADIIWVALGAPKQEYFMSRLKPHLSHGVMIGVGAVFKFYSGIDAKRAPEFMVKTHTEFLYRIMQEPKKQLKRCAWIIYTLPGLLIDEWRRKIVESKMISARHAGG